MGVSRTYAGIMPSTSSPVVPIAACVLLFAWTARGDNSEPIRSDIRVDSNLVLIPVSVTDSRNQPVMGLTPDSFRVFEGKAEQKVLRLSSDDMPLSVGIVFDTSHSMADKVGHAREAVAEFLKLANPDDEFFLVTFNSTTEVSVPFTSSRDEIRSGLSSVECKGQTALLDSIYLALSYMNRARNPRKALLIVSDGGDNHSRYTETEIRRITRETGAWIYALGIYTRGRRILPEDERGGQELLTTLAAETGGRHLEIHQPGEMLSAAARISLELRNQYVLYYSPTNAQADGKYRRVHVKLVQGQAMNLSWRSGYYAPAPPVPTHPVRRSPDFTAGHRELGPG